MKLIRAAHPVVFVLLLVAFSLALVTLTKPTVVTLVFFLLLVSLTTHFFVRIFVSWKPKILNHFLLIYLPLILSYLLFLGWQRIWDPVLLLPILLTVVLGELCWQTLGV